MELPLRRERKGVIAHWVDLHARFPPHLQFFKDGLEQLGPGGHDFLTLLGSHEGEGLVLDVGLAGSSSPFLSSKGQKVGRPGVWERVHTLSYMCDPPNHEPRKPPH